MFYFKQSLSPDSSFVREKSRSSQRLFDKHKNGKHLKGGDKLDNKIPYTEAVFLPHFPLRGEIEEHDFEVGGIIIVITVLKVIIYYKRLY